MTSANVDVVPLAAVCELNPRFSKESRPRDSDLVSFVPMAAVDERSASITAPESRPYSAVKRGFTSFREDDVLFAKITPCMENGKIALARGLEKGLGFGSTEFHVLRASSRVLPEWLRYYVLRPSFRAQAKLQMCGAVGQQRVPIDFIATSLIPLPSIDRQRHLVDLLSRAENIVRVRREAEQKGKAITPALFFNVFGDPATNPNQWPIRSLGDLLALPIRNGISPSKSGTHMGRVLTLSAITRGSFDTCAVKTAHFANPLDEMDEVRKADFLICRGNGNRSLVGAGCFALCDMPGVAFPDTAIAVRPQVDQLLSPFLATLWKTGFIRSQIERIAKTTNGTYKINQAGLASIKVPVPPIGIQRAFSSQVEEMGRFEARQELASLLATQAFQSLLARVFGEG